MNFNIFKPTVRAVVLQTDIARARMVLEGDVEFVRRAIRAFVRFSKLVEINMVDLFPIQNYVNETTYAGDLDMIPFAGWFHGVFSWLG